MAKEPVYSHRSNGNPKSQSARTGGGCYGDKIRYDNEATGPATEQDLLEEGVSSREPFDPQVDDYEYMFKMV